MSKENDKVDPEQLRKRLRTLAELIRQLDAEERLLDAVPQLLKQMGDLRAKLFEYEVRCTGRLLPKSAEPPEVVEAQRIVEEAAQRLEEAQKDWAGGWSPDDEEDRKG